MTYQQRLSLRRHKAIQLLDPVLRDDDAVARDVAMKLGVAAAIDLTHAPFAEQRHDFVRAETGTGAESHLGVAEL